MIQFACGTCFWLVLPWAQWLTPRSQRLLIMSDVEKPKLESADPPPFTLVDVAAVVGIILLMLFLVLLAWVAAMLTWTAQAMA